MENIAILDSESDELAKSIINNNDKIQFPEDEDMRPSSGNKNVVATEAEEVRSDHHYQNSGQANDQIVYNKTKKERRFIKQGVFIKKFTEELRINEQFNKLHQYMQDKIINDEFLLRIIVEPKSASNTVKRSISFSKDDQMAKSSKQMARSPS